MGKWHGNNLAAGLPPPIPPNIKPPRPLRREIKSKGGGDRMPQISQQMCHQADLHTKAPAGLLKGLRILSVVREKAKLDLGGGGEGGKPTPMLMFAAGKPRAGERGGQTLTSWNGGGASGCRKENPFLETSFVGGLAA